MLCIVASGPFETARAQAPIPYPPIETGAHTAIINRVAHGPCRALAVTIASWLQAANAQKLVELIASEILKEISMSLDMRKPKNRVLKEMMEMVE